MRHPRPPRVVLVKFAAPLFFIQHKDLRIPSSRMTVFGTIRACLKRLRNEAKAATPWVSGHCRFPLSGSRSNRSFNCGEQPMVRVSRVQALRRCHHRDPCHAVRLRSRRSVAAGLPLVRRVLMRADVSSNFFIDVEERGWRTGPGTEYAVTRSLSDCASFLHIHASRQGLAHENAR